MSGAFQDDDGDPLTFTATGLPAGLSISSAGVISGTINRSASQTSGGSYTVDVTAADADVETATDSFTWTITNPAPVALADTATVAEEGTVDVDILGNDSDDDPLTITSASVASSAGTVSVVGNQLRFVGADGFSGEAVIAYSVSDGEGGTASSTATVTVTPVNDAPEVASSLADRVAEDAETVSFDASSAFTDEDSGPLTFTATGLPAGLSISSAGAISGTINRSASQTGGGVYTVEVTATDADGATATDSFTWTITNPAPVPVADTATVAEEGTVDIDAVDNDTDDDPLTITSASVAASAGSVVGGRKPAPLRRG